MLFFGFNDMFFFSRPAKLRKKRRAAGGFSLGKKIGAVFGKPNWTLFYYYFFLPPTFGTMLPVPVSSYPQCAEKKNFGRFQGAEFWCCRRYTVSWFHLGWRGCWWTNRSWSPLDIGHGGGARTFLRTQWVVGRHETFGKVPGLFLVRISSQILVERHPIVVHR